ncbi:MAG: hypothetical protein ACRC6N_04630, partial [Plesiomonas sp.]|uniref:hypothetical protein n=1 Tax=Plesiomonas sp. TaxID=2486279 RepID=UPI003F314333
FRSTGNQEHIQQQMMYLLHQRVQNSTLLSASLVSLFQGYRRMQFMPRPDGRAEEWEAVT